MTRQSSSTKHTLWNGKLFRFNMKQHWPFVVGAIILLLIVMIIPTVIDLGTVNTRVIGMEHDFATADDISRWVVSQVSEFLRGDSIAAWIALLGLALVAGIVSLRFLNRKVGVNFWHSVPARRETYLINDFLTYGFYTLVAYAVTFGLQMLVLFSAIGTRVTSAQGTGLFLIALKGFGIGLLVYLYVYAVMILASALSGTDFMRLITAGVIALYPIVLHLSILLLMSEFAEHTDWTALFSYDIAGALAPIVRLFTAFNTSYPFYWYTALLVFLWSVFMIAVAVLLYRHRKSENAEQPMLYRIVAGVIKYATMLIATIVCGLLMRYIGGSYVWMVIGFIIGAVVSFMIINAIFAKSAKAMFKPFRGFVIFAIVFAVLFVIFPLDIFGLDAHIPTSGIENVDLTVDGQKYTLQGEDAAVALTICREALRNNPRYVGTEQEEVYVTVSYPIAGGQLASCEQGILRPTVDSTNSVWVNLTAHPSFGIPKIMRFSIASTDYEALIALIRASGTWRSDSLERLSHGSDAILSFPIFGVEAYFFDQPVYAFDEKGTADWKTDSQKQFAEICRLLSKTADQPSGRTIGYIYDDAIGVFYPICESDVEAILYILQNCNCNPIFSGWQPDYSIASSMDDVYAIAAQQFSSVVIYDWETDSLLTVSDPAEIFGMTKQFGPSRNHWRSSAIFDPDADSDRYTALVTYVTDQKLTVDSFCFETQQFLLPKDVMSPAGEWVKAQH